MFPSEIRICLAQADRLSRVEGGQMPDLSPRKRHRMLRLPVKECVVEVVYHLKNRSIAR